MAVNYKYKALAVLSALAVGTANAADPAAAAASQVARTEALAAEIAPVGPFGGVSAAEPTSSMDYSKLSTAQISNQSTAQIRYGLHNGLDPSKLSPMQLEAAVGIYRKKYRSLMEGEEIGKIKAGIEEKIRAERQKKLDEVLKAGQKAIDDAEAAHAKWRNAVDAEGVAAGKVRAAEEDLAVAEKKLHDYEAQISEAIKKNVNKGVTIKAGQHETSRETVHDRYIKAEKELEDARSNLAKAQSVRDEGDAKISALKSDGDKAQQEVEKAKQDVDKANAVVVQAEKAKNDADKGVADAQAKVGAAQAKVGEAQGVVAEAEKAVDAAESALSNSKDKLGAARKASKKADKGVARAEDGVKSATKGVVKAQRKFQSAKVDVDEAQAIVAAASSAVGAAKSALEVAEKGGDASKAAKAKKALGKAEKKLVKAKSALDDANACLAEREVQLREANVVVENAKKAVKEATDAANAAAKDVDSAKVGVEKAREGVDAAKKELAAAENMVDEKKAEVADAEVAVDDAKAKAKETIGELDKAKDIAKDAESAQKDAESNKDKFDKEMKSAQDEVKSLDAAVQKAKEDIKAPEKEFKDAEVAAEREMEFLNNAESQLIPLRAAALVAEDARDMAKSQYKAACENTAAAKNAYSDLKGAADAVRVAAKKAERFLELSAHDAGVQAEHQYDDAAGEREVQRQVFIDNEVNSRLEKSEILSELGKRLDKCRADVVNAEKAAEVAKESFDGAKANLKEAHEALSLVKGLPKPSRKDFNDDDSYAKACKDREEKIAAAGKAVDDAESKRAIAERRAEDAAKALSDAHRAVEGSERALARGTRDEEKVIRMQVLDDMRHKENLEIAKRWEELDDADGGGIAEQAAEKYREAKKRRDKAERELKKMEQALVDASAFEKSVTADNATYGARRTAAKKGVEEATIACSNAEMEHKETKIKAEAKEKAAKAAMSAANDKRSAARAALKEAEKAGDAASIEKARTAYDAANTAYAAAKNELKDAKENVSKVDDEGKGKVRDAEKALRNAKKNLDAIPKDRRLQDAAVQSEADKPTSKAKKDLNIAKDEYARAEKAFLEARREYRKYFPPEYETVNYSGAEADQKIDEIEGKTGLKFSGDRRWLARTFVDGEPLAREFEGHGGDYVAAAKEATTQAIDAGFYLAGFTVDGKNVFVDKGRFGPFNIRFVDKNGDPIAQVVGNGDGGENGDNYENTEFVNRGRLFTEAQILKILQGKDGAVREQAAFNFNEFRDRFTKLNAHPDIESANIQFSLPTDTFHYGYNGTNYVDDAVVFDEGLVEDPNCTNSNTRALATTVVVKEKAWPAPHHLILGIDNFNSVGAPDSPLGELDTWMARLTYQNMSLWDAGHSLTLSGNVSLGGALYGGSASYMVPQEGFFDFANLTLHGGYTAVGQDDVVTDVDVDGTGYYGGLLLSRRISDTGSSIIDICLGATYRYVESSMTIEGYEFQMGLNGDGYTIMPLSLALTYADSKLDSWNGRWYATAELVRNMGGSNLQELQAYRRAIDDENYLVGHFQLARLQLMPYFGTEGNGSPMFFARLDGQVSNGPLIGAEQFGIGGHATVRGYAEREFMGDSGFSATLEWRSPIFLGLFDRDKGLSSKDRWQYVFFFDMGYYTLEDGLGVGVNDSELIAGVGAGLRFAYTENLQLRFDWGIPLIRDDAKYETSSAGVGQLSVQYNF